VNQAGVGLSDRRADGDRLAPYLSSTRCVEKNKQTIEPPYPWDGLTLLTILKWWRNLRGDLGGMTAEG
jgi:hypothetical protein